MAYGTMNLEKRIKENIKNYSLSGLFDLEKAKRILETAGELAGLELLLTERHGEKRICIGDFEDFTPDVVNAPGRKVRVENRTVGHIYTQRKENTGENAGAERLLEQIISLLEALGEETYRRKEYSLYADALEEKMEREGYRAKHGERRDALTGTLNKSCFEDRMRVLDRAEVIPVAVINANINDWKFANDNFGEEESDRLIQIVAGILMQEATPEYIIGRVDGDVFHVLIPAPKDGEPESYVERIVRACDTYEDAHLSPSIAVGMVIKTNVEETLAALFTDAEYEMLQHKLEIKQSQAYQKRLRRGI